jgi:UDPglucose 6-dehydrogenase
VRAFDPAAMKESRAVLPEVEYSEDAYAVAKESDALVLATEWNQFRRLDLQRLKQLLKTPIFIDLRNVYDPDQMKQLGFTYTCVGRARIESES